MEKLFLFITKRVFVIFKAAKTLFCVIGVQFWLK